MRPASVLVVFVLACNQVFDLRDTKSPKESDTDSDGINDVIDNCPFTPNRDQLDSDFDSLGDACDPCPLGPQSGLDRDHDGVDDACDACLTGANSDEDLDSFLDGCDLCPAVAGEQIDSDNDGVGDQCDTSSAQHHRVFFDGFDPPKLEWNSFAPWHATAGGMTPENPKSGNPLFGAFDRAAAVRGIELHIDVATRVPPPDNQFDFVGVNLIVVRNAQPIEGCTMFGTPQGTWSTFGPQPIIVAPGVVKFHLFLQAASTGMMKIGCTINGHTNVTTTTYSACETWIPSLLTTVSTEFLSVDVVE